MNDQPQGIEIPAHVLPVPTSISAEARAALQRQIGPDGLPLNSVHVMPEPHDLPAWQRLQATANAWYASAQAGSVEAARASIETVRAGSATVHVAAPAAAASKGQVIIDLHGGALVFGGGDACLVSTRLQADQYGLLTYGVDYRMPPDHPYPAALDDCMAAYRHVLDRHRPRDIIVSGRSAGGNLAAALLLRARDEGLPAPGALILLSPEVDLTESGDSFVHNRLADVVLPGSLMKNNILYAHGAALDDPYLSPLFGDLSSGFPPTFLQTGTRDLFLSNTVRMHRALRRSGVPAELHVFEAMPHGGFGDAPEDRELVSETKRFLRATLGVPYSL